MAFLSVLCLLSIPQAALASGEGEAGETGRCSITVRYADDGRALPDVPFSIYRAARMNERGELEATEDFSAYSPDFDLHDVSAWRDLAGTLEAYALRDRLPAAGQERTDSDGIAAFTDLPPGLYLVRGETTERGGYTYTPEPALVLIPYLDEHGAAHGEALVEPKKDVAALPDEDEPEPEELTLSVTKIWNDSGRESSRPEKIEVELLRNGAVYSTVELNRDNNWRHYWTGLSPEYTWQITEKEVPAGYTVTIGREGRNYIITNTAVPDKPRPPDEPPVVVPDEPAPLDGPPDGPEPEPPEGPVLPQTGMLQWPILVLASAGLLSLLIGVFLRNRAGRHED